MIQLYQFPGPWDVCSASPFCAKLEGFLRWQNIPYESFSIRSLRGAPKGKVPYIVAQGRVMGDSNLIIDHLIKEYRLNPNEGLTPGQLAAGRALRYMCEESLYWAMVYFRWMEDAGWVLIKEKFFSMVPWWLRPLAEWKIRGYVRKELHMQGMGRHSREEIAAIACADLRALSDFLGDKPYFFGDAMTLADLVVFSVVANFLTGPFDSPVSRYAATLGNLSAHTGRVRERCFGKTPALP